MTSSDGSNVSYRASNSLTRGQILRLPVLNHFFQPRPVGGARAFPRQQHRPRQLALRQIRAERFARQRLRAEQIHAIVINLIRRAERRAEFPQRRALLRRAPRSKTPPDRTTA